MKIIIAPNAYKESLSADDVALAIYRSFKKQFPKANIICHPIADGGEGSLEYLLKSCGGKTYYSTVTGPLRKKQKAAFAILKDGRAVIEMAQSSGLALVPKHLRNPLKTSTYGCGELIRKALDKGCRNFIICLGGSATCDGGIGALAALGFDFKDAKGKVIPYTGGGLARLKTIDISKKDPRLAESKFTLAVDVDNVLVGKEGAIMYAPQKGANKAQTQFLKKAFENYAKIIQKYTSKKVTRKKGSGAAGGLAAGLYAFLNASLTPGASFFITEAGLKKDLKKANLVITGEGQIDHQTIKGKAPIVVAKLAKEFNIPVIAIAGRLGNGYDKVYKAGIDAVFSITPGPMDYQDSILQAKSLLEATANNIARLLAST